MSADQPLSVVVDVRSLGRAGRHVHHTADEKERARLARHNDILSVDRFEIDADVRPWRMDGVIVEGRVTAIVTQACVVTLDPLVSTLDVPISQTFVPGDIADGVDQIGTVDIDPDADDPPEPFDGRTVDVGALASELFSVELDPYPRGPDATLDDAPGGIDRVW